MQGLKSTSTKNPNINRGRATALDERLQTDEPPQVPHVKHQDGKGYRCFGGALQQPSSFLPSDTDAAQRNGIEENRAATSTRTDLFNLTRGSTNQAGSLCHMHHPMVDLTVAPAILSGRHEKNVVNNLMFANILERHALLGQLRETTPCMDRRLASSLIREESVSLRFPWLAATLPPPNVSPELIISQQR